MLLAYRGGWGMKIAPLWRLVAVFAVAAAAAAAVAGVSPGPALAQPGGFGDMPEDA